MTTPDRPRPRATRSSALRDDLLDDLRQAAPVPAAHPVRPAAAPPEERRGTAWVRTAMPRPTLELRVTLWQWSAPDVRRLRGGVVLSAGPVRLSLTGLG
ncbi:hypothetical protein SAMN06893096_102260 [Geodermatophilus pulveris]|uniref:Uncharacterized protein n=1 Tax=Geodermatophilus pulveris TaxID=1564159 RepID=A0A239C592_9ACTN|nr:hypothetical protein [Geodermatophilus pulveris]SNS15435.1 hypothetical protein SAMN06893096_102260 [Geodermatophilus pulveris]